MEQPTRKSFKEKLTVTGYYGILLFPLLCLIIGIFCKDKTTVQLQTDNKDPTPQPMSTSVSTETYQRELTATLDALDSYARQVQELNSLNLAKISDAMYEQLAGVDAEWENAAKTTLSALISDVKEHQYAEFERLANARGKTLEQFKNTTFQEWHDVEGRVALYSQTLNGDVQTLRQNIAKTLSEDMHVKIHKILSGPSLAFLTTFERPWRLYSNQEFERTGRGDFETGVLALNLFGRILIGYDMTKVKLYTVHGDGEAIARYRIVLPKPEIKEVIFDYEKTDVVRMHTTLFGKYRMGRRGSQTLYRELFSKTPRLKELFLRDFQINNMYDANLSQENIRKMLEPYFKLQGNRVIIESTPTTFDEMITAYLYSEHNSSTPISLEVAQ